MMENTAILVHKLKKVLPDLLSASYFEAVLQAGKHHTSNCTAITSPVLRSTSKASSGSAKKATQVKLSLMDLRLSTTCDRCFRLLIASKSLPFEVRKSIPASDFLSDLYRFLKEVDKVEKALKSKRGTPIATTRTLKAFKAAEMEFAPSYQAFLRLNALTPKDEQRLREVMTVAGDLKDEVERSLVSETKREISLAEVRKSFGPSQADYFYDDTLMLVGFQSYYDQNWTELARTLILQFKVAAPNTVVALPLYAAEFLLKASARQSMSGMHPLVVAKDASASTIETAAKLWDPSGSGSMRSLAAAFRAATALEEA